MSTRQNDDEQLLREITAALARYPADITVTTKSLGGENTMMDLDVNKADYGSVHGSMGKHLQALRTIFQFIGARQDRKIKIMLLEPTKGQREERLPFTPNHHWNERNIMDLLNRILIRILRRPFAMVALSAEQPDATTTIEITADPAEQAVIEALTTALQPLFHAIGKKEGRQLYVEAPAAVPTG